MKAILLAGTLGLTAAVAAQATPVTYKVDPSHTYPSFAADHMAGLSVWRGKFNSSFGTIVYDKEAKSGTVDITIDTTSLDFGNDKLNEHAMKEPSMFDVARYPTATFKGKLAKFNGSTPTEVAGELTLHGVTRPVTLKLDSFLCKPHPMLKKEVCGADASTTINRGDFGVTYALGPPFNFNPEVKLSIQVEANIQG